MESYLRFRKLALPAGGRTVWWSEVQTWSEIQTRSDAVVGIYGMIMAWAGEATGWKGRQS